MCFGFSPCLDGEAFQCLDHQGGKKVTDPKNAKDCLCTCFCPLTEIFLGYNLAFKQGCRILRFEMDKKAKKTSEHYLLQPMTTEGCLSRPFAPASACPPQPSVPLSFLIIILTASVSPGLFVLF